MSSINDDIFDRSIDHSAMTRLAENGIQSDVQRIIRRHKDRLRKGLSVKGTNVTSKAYVSPLGSLMTYTTHTLVNMSEYHRLYKTMKKRGRMARLASGARE